MRLDKYLAHANFGSRKEVGELIKSGRVTVGGKTVKDRKLKVKDEDEVRVDGFTVVLEEYMYFMLNKPQNVISATESFEHETVIDLIEHSQYRELFPVGRLDIDTTGLLIITNDGKLSHQLLSPKKEVFKTYYCKLKHDVSKSDITFLETGIPLKDFTTKPAKVEVIEEDEVLLSISEGKFHQVKRMFKYLNNEVLELKRVKFGNLVLDETLEAGEYRRLTEDELTDLKKLI